MPNLSNSELERIYNEAVNIDQKIYDEQKSNVLLKSGYHYGNRGSKFYDRVRRSTTLSDDQKLRLTINHIYKICKIYENNILALSPGVTILPKNQAQRQDQTKAEMHLAVWQDFKYRYNYSSLVEQIVSDFVTIGEFFVKTMFDPYDGDVVGYRPYMTVDGVEQEEIRTGKYVIDIIQGYDVFRHPGAKTFDESPFVGIRKMVMIDDLKDAIKYDETLSKEEKQTKLGYIQKSSEEAFSVFKGATSEVVDSKDMVLLKEFYYRPSIKYPKGYFYIKTSSGILWEGELQTNREGKAIFPVRYELYDVFQGMPRGFSPIKQARPLQGEINRTNSKIAETQVTLGDDKIVTYMGGGITEGQKLAGIREIKVSTGSQRPEVIAGRSGEQYLGYNQAKVQELYQLMSVSEDWAQTEPVADITADLYKSLKQKKKFSMQAAKIQRFLIGWAQDVLELAKAYYPDEVIIKTTGEGNAVNIPEFKSSDDLSYEIKVEASNEDVESMMGKYLALTNALQYAGGQMTREDVGKLLLHYPFANGEAIFGHLTKDEKVLKNLLNQLDRGEQPRLSAFNNNEYLLKGISDRMGEEDFEYKITQNPEVLEAYLSQYAQRKAKVDEMKKAIQNENAGVIPTGGYLVKCDVYTTDPNNPSKTRRLELPSEAIEDLEKKLAKQGAYIKLVEEMPQLAMGAGQLSLEGVNNG